MNAQNKKVEFANTLRGLASLFVVISHYFYFYWLGRPIVANMTNMAELPLDKYPVPNFVYLLNPGHGFSWGPYGVSIFFLISGFVIPFSLKNSTALQFFINRTLRIYPTYFVGFTITLLSIYAGSRYFGNPWQLTPSEAIIHLFPGLRDIMWSRNIDGVIWTLEVEVKFYIICLLAIALFKKRSLWVFVLPAVILAITAASNFYSPILKSDYPEAYKQATNFMYAAPYLVFMFIGVVFHYLHSDTINRYVASILVVSIFGVMWLTWTNSYFADQASLIYSYGYGLLTFSFAFIFPGFFKGNPVLNFLAKISYPLYVVHSLAGYLIIRVLLEQGIAPILAIAGALICVIPLAYALHLCVEAPSMRLERHLRKLSRKDSSTNVVPVDITAKADQPTVH